MMMMMMKFYIDLITDVAALVSYQRLLILLVLSYLAQEKVFLISYRYWSRCYIQGTTFCQLRSLK